MHPMAIILVSAQISRNVYQISAHHASKAGLRRASDTMIELTPISRRVKWQVVEPKPIPKASEV